MKILLLLFFIIAQIGLGFAATWTEQFNHLITPRDVLGGKDFPTVQNDVRVSKDGSDNFAIIYVQGKSVLISSSIINNRLHKFLLGENISTEQSPVSVMDLLYLYRRPYDGALIDGHFPEKLAAARADANQGILIDMLREVVGQFMAHNSKTPGDIFENVQAKYALSGELEKVEFVDRRRVLTLPLDRLAHFVAARIIEDLPNKRLVIIDFLQRLRQYADSIEAIPAGTHDTSGVIDGEDILLYTAHRTEDKQILLREIDQQLREIPSEESVTNLNLARSIVNLARLIRGPNFKIGDIWRMNPGTGVPTYRDHNPNQYVSAITHTEQMVDWLSRHFGGNILVKISGKAPCVKCSHYIKYATDVMPGWNARTVIGYTVGWSGRNPMSECMQYRYPTRVFNATSVDTGVSPWALIAEAPKSVLTRKFDRELPGTYDAHEFGHTVGTDKSHCYAIENVNGTRGNEEATSYKGQLTIQADGSITQIVEDRGDKPILAPFQEPHVEMPHDGEFIDE